MAFHLFRGHFLYQKHVYEIKVLYFRGHFLFIYMSTKYKKSGTKT